MRTFEKLLKKRWLIVIILFVLFAAFLCVFYCYDPSTCVFFPKCPVHFIFGIPCPGCGSQRAIHSLLHLDFRMAMRYNAFAVFLIPVLAVLVASSAFREKFPSFYKVTHHRYIASLFVFFVPLWWILRIIFHWYV